LVNIKLHPCYFIEKPDINWVIYETIDQPGTKKLFLLK
jgi:hypothetical protein